MVRLILIGAGALGLLIALVGRGGMTGMVSSAGANDMWSGPPPWTITRDDSVQPAVYWNQPGDRNDPSCTVPSPGSGDERVAVGLYESVSLSSAAVGGEDQETNFVTVRIEPGKKPLYLVLTSYESMVWRLTGATDRVAQVVVSTYHREKESGAPASGVIGVPARKLTFLTSACLDYFDEPTKGTALMERLVGTAADGFRYVSSYSALDISVPSGTITTKPQIDAAPPAGFDPDEWREATRYWPGGVTLVPPRLVASPSSTRSYRVLPSQAGLAQLLGSGAMVRDQSGFRIVKAIPRVPAEMAGAHSEKLSLAPGLPEPEGDLGHSCLTIEGSGEVRGVDMLCNRLGSSD